MLADPAAIRNLEIMKDMGVVDSTLNAHPIDLAAGELVLCRRPCAALQRIAKNGKSVIQLAHSPPDCRAGKNAGSP